MRGLRTTVLQTDKLMRNEQMCRETEKRYHRNDLIEISFMQNMFQVGSHGTFIRMNNMLDHKANKI